MEYGIYTSTRNAAWQCLIDCGISELPIRPVKIAKMHGLQCKKCDDTFLHGDSGQIKIIDNIVTIIFNTENTIQRQRYTIMHELGHYVLGHLGETPLSRSESECRNIEEQAADKFAIDMLAPSCVLWGLNLHTPEEISDICDISLQSAKYRAERMKILYEREQNFLKTRGYSCFLQSPLEQKVYQQFHDFIEKRKLFTLFC